MRDITLGTTRIRQHNELYSLNDMHRASGGEQNQQPSFFLRNDQTKALIAEINSANLQSFQTVTGRNGGTYACRELVIAYAAWISPAFHLKVLRTFLDKISAPSAPLPAG